ncbi:receptor-like protein 50, partial [Quercus suber]
LFSGKIPYEISQLSSLVSLDLSYNDLLIKTLVWKRIVDNLTLLRELLLDGTNMSSIRPNSLTNLSFSLTTLSLHDCDLRNNSSLKFLDLSWISFSRELPNSISSLKSLKHLNLEYRKFTRSIPTLLGSLT